MKLELRTMKNASITLAILLILSIGIPAMGHHSAAGQDFTKRVEVSGMVKSWRIVNPHGKLVVLVRLPAFPVTVMV